LRQNANKEEAGAESNLQNANKAQQKVERHQKFTLGQRHEMVRKFAKALGVSAMEITTLA